MIVSGAKTQSDSLLCSSGLIWSARKKEHFCCNGFNIEFHTFSKAWKVVLGLMKFLNVRKWRLCIFQASLLRFAQVKMLAQLIIPVKCVLLIQLHVLNMFNVLMDIQNNEHVRITYYLIVLPRRANLTNKLNVMVRNLNLQQVHLQQQFHHVS